MTVCEANVALNAAPMDDKISRLNPGKTRRQMTEGVRALVNGKANQEVILISPATAKMVAQAAQDCEFPVPLRFNYGTNGAIVVSWNQEEVRIRNAAVDGASYRKEVEEPNNYTVTHKTLVELTSKKLQQKVLNQSFYDLVDAAGAMPLAIPDSILEKLQAAQKAQLDAIFFDGPVPLKKKPEPPPPPEPPKPEPKPDVTSPTFVLKRPKVL